MDPQFQELAAQITRDVTQAVTRDVTEAVTRDVTEAVKRDVTEALRDHVSDVVSAAERRLADQARINVEAVKAEARLAAEGYGGVLESIDVRLTSIQDDLAKQASHYDKVLANHNERITALEHRPG